MTRALVLSGGPHPFHETTPRVVAMLEDLRCAVDVVQHPDQAAAALRTEAPALLVTNTLRWRMLGADYDQGRAEHAYATSDDVRQTFPDYLRGGGRMLALHGAPICFDDWPEWGDLVGASWSWGASSHPLLGPMEVRVIPGHPLTDGLEDFTIHDEAYGFMDLRPDVEPLMVSAHGGVDHPMLWVRTVGDGLEITSTLGHGAESFDHPTHRELIERSMRFLLNTGAGDRS